MNLICFTHSHYNGSENPVLSCKTCCQIFLAALKVSQATQQEAKQEERRWMLEKVNQARQAIAPDATRSASQPK